MKDLIGKRVYITWAPVPPLEHIGPPVSVAVVLDVDMPMIKLLSEEGGVIEWHNVNVMRKIVVAFRQPNA